MTTDLENENNEGFRLGPFMRFFLFCSGADTELLIQCPPAERIKHSSLGVVVFITGILAALSAGYTIYIVFNSIFIAIILGGIWGVLIFNLDRFIVSTIKKNNQKIDQWKQVIPRLMLAVVLAIIISKPLEIKIFEQEIDEILYYSEVNKLEEIDQLYDDKISRQNAAIESLRMGVVTKFDLREKYYEAYKCECDGTCGTGAGGVGSECLRKEKKYLKSDAEYQLAKAESEMEITSIKTAIAALYRERDQYQEKLRASFSSGLLVRLRALNELPRGTSLAIILLIICIETAPVFTKLLSPYGPYDHLLK